MPVAVEDVVAVGEKVAEAVGDGEDDRGTLFSLDLSGKYSVEVTPCLLYTSDAADDLYTV